LIEYYIYPKTSLIGSIRFEDVQASNTVTYPSKSVGGDENIFSNSYSFRAPQILLSFMAKKIISRSRFSILGGVNIGILLADKQEERVFINKPNIKFPDLDSLGGLYSTKGYTPSFSDDSRTSITFYKGEIYQRTALQLGLTAGLQYDLPIYTLDEATQKFVTLTPSVLFNYNLTTYSDYEKLRAWNVSAGFVLKVGL